MVLDLGSHLRITAQKLGGKTAIVFGARRLTYRDINERASRVANMMAGMGLQAGDRSSGCRTECGANR